MTKKATGGRSDPTSGSDDTDAVDDARGAGDERPMGPVLTADDADLNLERISNEQEYDKVLKHGRVRRTLILVVATGWIGWQMWTAATVPLAPVRMRSLHMAFAFVLAFLMLPSLKGRLNRHVALVLDLVLGGLGAVVMLHLFRDFASPDFLRVAAPLPIDQAAGWVALGIVLLAVYRTTGLPLAIAGILSISYAMFGNYIPDPVGHGGFTASRVMSFLYLRVEGMLGVAVGASATSIFPVVIFGALLVAMGGGAFLAQLAAALLGKVRGASAKITVISTGMFATVSGAGATDVASTGPFTIPLMRRQGFSPRFAAATESAAAIGAQVAPPIMGASAFVMAEFLNVSYATIVRHAILPAALFYTMVFLSVHFNARAERIKPLTIEIASPLRILGQGWQFLLPLLYLFGSLTILGQSVGRSAFQGLVLLLVLDLGRRLITRQPLELVRLARGAVNGVKNCVIVATACAAVQILIATVGLTGIGIKLSSLMVAVAGGSMLLLLILTMFASILLGTGLPTVPTYLILAILTAPALSDFGVPLLAAHFFVLYFGVMSDLTPPTALGPTIAAGIAQAPLMRTMSTALKLGLGGFILPYMFVYRPALLLQGNAAEIAITAGIMLFAIVLSAIGLAGFLYAPLSVPVRVVLLLAAAALIPPVLVANIVGAAAGLAILVVLWVRRPKLELALPG